RPPEGVLLSLLRSALGAGPVRVKYSGFRFFVRDVPPGVLAFTHESSGVTGSSPTGEFRWVSVGVFSGTRSTRGGRRHRTAGAPPYPEVWSRYSLWGRG